MSGGLTQTILYDAPGNFTFDPAKVAFVSSKAQLKNIRPANATFYASYDVDVDGTWGDGTLTGTAQGGASVSGGKLDLKGGTLQYVDYGADLNADSQQVGAVRCLVTPNYSGTPSGVQPFVAIIKAAGDAKNSVSFFHSTSGHLRITISDENGDAIVAEEQGIWNPTAAQQYELELDYDLTTGATRLFVDGVQFGPTRTGTGVRSADIGLLRVGTNYAATYLADFELDDLVVFDAVQHTANYTPGEPLDTYSTANPTILLNSTTLADVLESFSATLSASGSDAVKFNVRANGEYRWWTGSAWATADGSYAKANTAAEIDTNAATLDISEGKDVTVLAFLHSEDGLTTPTLTSVVYEYSFYVQPEALPTRCMVYGWVTSPTGAAEVGVAVQAINSSFEHGVRLINAETVSTTTNSDGYWELELIETETIELAPYTFKIEGRIVAASVQVPDAGSAAFSDLDEAAGTSGLYVTVQGIRDLGVDMAVIDDYELEVLIRLCQALLERATRQWFVARTVQFSFDGNNSDTMHLGVPAISLEWLKINDSTTALDVSLYKVYSGASLPDDRKNPRIKLVRSDAYRDIYTAPEIYGSLRFRKGRQNQELSGSFGYVEADGSVPLPVQEALKRLVIERITNPMFTAPTAPTPPPAAAAGGGVIVEEATDGHRIKYATAPLAPRRSGLSGITQDAFVQDVIRLYRAPIGVATPSDWSHD